MNSDAIEQKTMHGVFLDILDVGVLLTGASGIGKSEIALSLIKHGHALIADDAIIFTKKESQTIMGTSPPLLQDFLEVRGLGILNIRAIFGDAAIRDTKQLQLIVNIQNMNEEELQNIDRLHGMRYTDTLFDVTIPKISIPLAAGRNLSILIETAVRNQLLKATGYDAANEFIKQQKNFSSRIKS